MKRFRYWGEPDWNQGDSPVFLDALGPILDAVRVTVCVNPDGTIELYPPQVTDAPLFRIDLENRHVPTPTIENVEVHDEQYATIHFPDPDEHDNRLTVKHDDEGLVFDWWSDDEVLDTAFLFWNDIDEAIGTFDQEAS